MEFKITEAEAQEFAYLEESAGCDVGAGFDWGAGLGSFLASANSYVDHEKLLELLRDRLGSLLSQEEIKDAARSFQEQGRDRVVEKYQSPKSA
ncbi:hypothetical protein K9N68_05805 [Kovacikia minuta CCNUW1]|uniref:hypothetical protein n=1 Tax=Kovacikia minuta TaxID=2931930 RepID=UPI001CCECB93|nr:hypothetical protein [Kovacikia minuta]UBF27460.1 hypothetical protein K9N68_05805 [Kovacikia minuta CCNUW1]